MINSIQRNIQKMPPKRLTRANLQTNNSSGKVIPKKSSIVTPTKSLKAKKSTSKSVPVQKKTFNLKTRINAVVNTKSGLAKTFKTPIQAQTYLKDMQHSFGSLTTQDMQFLVFDDRKAMNIACNEYKKSQKQAIKISPQNSQEGIKAKAFIDLPSSETENPNEINSLASTKRTANLTEKCTFQELPSGLSDGDTPLTVANQGNSHMLADNLKTYYSSAGSRFQLTLLPQILSVSDKQAYQIFALDLIENKSSNTLWTHKPSAWERVFKMDKSLPSEEGGHNIVDEFFYSLRSTFRRNISKGPNIKKTIVTKNQRVVDCQILWGMINCTDNTENKLKTEILKFSNLASNPAIQQAYFVSMQNLGSTFKPLLDQIMPADKTAIPRMGEYWEKLIAVCSGEIEVIHLESMNEIFQDDIINTAVGILWAAGGLSPSMWSAEMNLFAFGHP
jgi:hypothetical protein